MLETFTVQNKKVCNYMKRETLTKDNKKFLFQMFSICVGKDKKNNKFKYIPCKYYGNTLIDEKALISFSFKLDIDTWKLDDGKKFHQVYLRLLDFTQPTIKNQNMIVDEAPLIDIIKENEGDK